MELAFLLTSFFVRRTRCCGGREKTVLQAVRFELDMMETPHKIDQGSNTPAKQLDNTMVKSIVNPALDAARNAVKGFRGTEIERFAQQHVLGTHAIWIEECDVA